MPDPSLPGFSYDLERARAAARLLLPLLNDMKTLGATPPDQLAAIGLLVAHVLRGRGLARVPDQVVRALAVFVQDALTLGTSA